MKSKLKILHLEDTPFDVEMVERELKKTNIIFEKLVVDNKKDFEKGLKDFLPDIVLSDHSLASFDSIRALELVKKISPEIPFILVTSTVSEEFAADIIKLGAADYILKDRLKRLPAAINSAIKHRRAEKEKINAAAILKQSEENYRTIMERLTDGFVALDKDWNYTYLNKVAGVIMNRSASELIGKNIWTEFPEGIGRAFYKAYNTAMNEQQYIHLEEYYEPLDRWLENHIYPSPDGLSVFFRDITERKKAEKAIIESEEKYRTLVEQASDGIFIADNTGKFLVVNNSASKISGYTAAELRELTIYNLVHPESLAAAPFHFEEMLRPEGARTERRMICKDNTVIDVEISAKFLSDKRFIAFVRDISERKKTQELIRSSEEKYRTMIERVSDGFFAMDLDWRITYINNVAEQLLERPPGYLAGKKMTDEFPEGIGRAFYNGYVQALQTGSNVHLQEYSIALDKWLSAGVYPSPTGVSVYFTDISKQIKAEKQKEFDNNNLHALINNTKDLMWSVDRDHNLITSNKAFDELLIAMTGKILLKGSSIFIPEFNAKQLLHYRSYYERAFKGEAFTEIEHDDTLDDFWSEISFYPIYEEAAVIGTACFSRNITDRKKAEEEIRKSLSEKKAMAERMSVILNTLPANIALLDHEGVIVDVNGSWKNFADGNGFIGNNYCIGDNYLSVSENALGEEEADGKKVATGIAAVLKNKTKDFVFEYSCNAPGIKRWFRMVATPLHEKEYAGAVVMHIDISELRRLEKERLETKLEERRKITMAILQGQEKERNHIGQELHDNINQILAGTKLYLGMAGKKDDATKELMKYPMELIDTSIEEIRLLCSKLVTPLKNINLEEMIRDILSKFQLNSNIETDFIYVVSAQSIPDDLQLNIYRIIQEQLNNILKYAAAQHVAISITADNKTINILVADDGNGFDVEKKRTGIGISNIINRVETFKGEIKIESSPGKGCRTNISIPYL